MASTRLEHARNLDKLRGPNGSSDYDDPWVPTNAKLAPASEHSAAPPTSKHAISQGNLHDLIHPLTNTDSILLTIFDISFKTRPIPSKEKSCWQHLFANPVIALGFPVPQRAEGFLGLEIPVEIMAALGGARHAIDFEGGLVIKGLAMMFVPIKREESQIQWHLIQGTSFSNGGLRNRIARRAMLEQVNHESLATKRSFLGWWAEAATHLGTADASIGSLDWSTTEQDDKPIQITSFSIGLSHTVTGQLNFALGAKDGKFHFSQPGPFEMTVHRIQHTKTVLYDQCKKRAWMVSGLDVVLSILHVRQHRLKLYKRDGKDVTLPFADPTIQGLGESARQVIEENRSLKLSDHSEYSFEDAVLDLSSWIEGLCFEEDTLNNPPGLKVELRLPRRLRGWEFMDIVEDKRILRRKVQTIHSNVGWMKLVRDVNAPILFAKNYGEVIIPVKTDLLCKSWRLLPQKEHYLAVACSIIETLYEETGSSTSHKYLTSKRLKSHRGKSLFEPCTAGSLDICACDRSQRLSRGHFKKSDKSKRLGKLAKNGCIILVKYHVQGSTKKQTMSLTLAK